VISSFLNISILYRCISPTVALSYKMLAHTSVSAILTIYRESFLSRNDMDTRREIGQNANDDLFNVYLDYHRQEHVDCLYNPKHISILLIDVGSNEDISKHYKSAAIHNAINDNWTDTSLVAVVVRELDGLSTNACGLAKLFRSYLDHNVLFCCHEHASGFTQFPLRAFVDTVDAVLSGDAVADESCSLFVQRMLQVAEETEKSLVFLPRSISIFLGLSITCVYDKALRYPPQQT
jgi:hypothetical protein